VTRQAELVVVIVATLGLLMMVVERSFPSRHFPKVDGWIPRAILINGYQVLAILLAGIGWNGWMSRHGPGRRIIGEPSTARSPAMWC
jgi:hypothetical protein